MCWEIYCSPVSDEGKRIGGVDEIIASEKTAEDAVRAHLLSISPDKHWMTCEHSIVSPERAQFGLPGDQTLTVEQCMRHAIADDLYYFDDEGLVTKKNLLYFLRVDLGAHSAV